MEKKTKEQQQAELLYLHTDFDQQQIADFLHVSRKTLFRWIRENHWKRAKHTAKHAPSILIEQLYGQLGELNNFIKERTDRPYATKEEADIQRKLSLTIATIKGQGKCLVDYIEMMATVSSELYFKDKTKSENAVVAFDTFIKDYIRERDDLDGPLRTYLKGMNRDRRLDEWAEAKKTFTPPPAKISITDDDGNTFSADPQPDHQENPDDILREAFLKVSNLSATEEATPKAEEITIENVVSDDKEQGNNTCPDSYREGNDEAKRDNDGTIISTSENDNSLKNNNLENKGTAPLSHSEETNKWDYADNKPSDSEPVKSTLTTAQLARRNSMMPPEKRPSPFRDGDILWVNNIDDVDNRLDSLGNEWGERKIGDTIRYYPGMDPYERKNRAA